MKGRKKTISQKRVFPGYILVQMMLDDDSWFVVRNTPGVTGFVGGGAKPSPLSKSEVDPDPSEGRVRETETEDGIRRRYERPRHQGTVRRLLGQYFEIDVDKGKLKVHISIFGRETPVELTFDRLTKL